MQLFSKEPVILNLLELSHRVNSIIIGTELLWLISKLETWAKGFWSFMLSLKELQGQMKEFRWQLFLICNINILLALYRYWLACYDSNIVFLSFNNIARSDNHNDYIAGMTILIKSATASKDESELHCND